LFKKFLQRQQGDLISSEERKKRLDELMEETLEQAITVDASLKGAVESEKVKMQKSLDALEEKLRKAAKKKEESSVQQIQTVKEKLFPSNGLQERHDNFLAYYSRYGEQFLIELKSNLDPFDKQFTILSED
jgi:uncharacterized protein YllA (UPF0747 family)